MGMLERMRLRMEEGDSASESNKEIDVDTGLRLLATVADALGLDVTDDADQDLFLHFLKQTAANKATLKKRMSNFTQSKAAKAFKTIKAAQ